MRTAIVVLALLLVGCVAYADDFGTEVSAVGEVIAENVELSLLGGSIGWGAGLYWPLGSWHGVTGGVFGALGTEAVAAGLGAKMGVSIPALGNLVNFVGLGIGVRNEDIGFDIAISDLKLEVFVGKTISIR